MTTARLDWRWRALFWPLLVTFGLLVLIVTVEQSRGAAHVWAWRSAAVCLVAMCLPRGWIALAATAPILLVYEPFGFGGVIGVIMYTPLFLLLSAGRRMDVVWAGLTLGLFQTLVLSAWLAPAISTPVRTEWLLAIIGSVMWCVCLAAVRFLLRTHRAGVWLTAGLPILTFEWLRTQTPGLRLPCHLTAHALGQNLWIAQLAEPLGILGLSLFGIFTSLLVARSFLHWRLHEGRPAAWKPAAVAATLLGGAILFAGLRLTSLGHVAVERVGFRVVQHFESTANRDRATEERYTERVDRAIRLGDARVIVLPENAMYVPADQSPQTGWLEPYQVEQMLRDSASSAVVVGGASVRVTEGPEGRRFKVSCMVLAADHAAYSRDKLILAPVGEAPPFQGWPLLRHLGRWIAGGDSRVVSDDTRAAVPLGDDLQANVCFCFEHLVPGIWHRRAVVEAVDVQLCLADVSSFGYNPLERKQNTVARRLCAIERRTPLLYAANGGSELYDASGRLRHQLHPNDDTALWMVPVAERRESFATQLMTFRARFCHWTIGSLLAIGLMLGLGERFVRRGPDQCAEGS